MATLPSFRECIINAYNDSGDHTELIKKLNGCIREYDHEFIDFNLDIVKGGPNISNIPIEEKYKIFAVVS